MIAVIGGDPCSDDEAKLAHAVGREVATRGHVLVSGGRGGVMRESCCGAREAGGHTVGVLPGDDRSEMNEFVEFPVVTGMGHARNTIVARTADALIAIGGRYGTLSEIAFALVLGRPVVGLGTWRIILPGGDEVPLAATCTTAAEAVDACERAIITRE